MYEQIDRYLENDLSASERVGFEQRLEEDGLFLEEYQSQKELFEAMNEHASLHDIKEEVVKTEQSYFKKDEKSYSMRSLVLSVASMAAVVFLVTFFGMNYLNEHRLKESSIAYKELSGSIEEMQEKQNDLWAMFQKNKKSYDYVFGTALYLTDSLYLTNKHLVNKAGRVELNGWKSKVYAVDSLSDLALLKVTDSNFVPPPVNYKLISSRSYLFGNEVFTLGFPKKTVVYKPGVISSLTGSNDDTLQFEITCQLNEGNSGSPVFDFKGDLLGLVTGKSKTQVGAGYVISSDVIEDFLGQQKVTLPRKRRLRKYSDLDLVQSSTASVVRVKAFN